MKQTWRWFGPKDAVSLSDIRQAGATGIVTALYHIPPGDPWPMEEITRLRHDIRAAGLSWDVVESLPISEAIRLGAPERDTHIAAWIASAKRLAACGIATICYNFMPVLDWTRTDLAFPRPSGARALRFDLADFAAFDLYVLSRTGAEADYTEATLREAHARRASLDGQALTATILAGLPGAVESWNLESFRHHLARYAEIDADALRANLRYFLEAVVPEAQSLGLRLCAHPDDPPWPLFGLPRILSTRADYQWLVDTAPAPANGVTFCTGSLGARPDNDLPAMATALGPHIHFAHLRNVRREAETIPCSFFEDDHLAGSTDMVAVIRALLGEEARRRAEGRADAQIPMRPDHGQMLLDDHRRTTAPGYPAIGRLKGLAELRGVVAALEATP
ncbi:mannonate dehydratase [Roseobacteraceae bacterium S113]